MRPLRISKHWTEQHTAKLREKELAGTDKDRLKRRAQDDKKRKAADDPAKFRRRHCTRPFGASARRRLLSSFDTQRRD